MPPNSVLRIVVKDAVRVRSVMPVSKAALRVVLAARVSRIVCATSAQTLQGSEIVPSLVACVQ